MNHDEQSGKEKTDREDLKERKLSSSTINCNYSRYESFHRPPLSLCSMTEHKLVN